MVTVNVAGLDDTMFSDTLFGHARGAYTGAVEARDGLIERGAGGTVFLDEIGDLSPSSQLKLLRLFEDGEYYPLGADEPRRTTARFVVATNRDPRVLVQEGHFRKDLYYRLSVHEIAAPPLRDRRCDIDLLAEHFLEEAARELDRSRPYLPPEILDYLHRYRFPGNVRELRSIITHAVSRATNGSLTLEPVREFIQQERMLSGHGDAGAAGDAAAEGATPDAVAFPEHLPSMKEMRGLLIEEALRRSGGNQSLAAALIGLTPSAINKYLRQRV
jgi:transcriptional regulator with GAF, ATPase, and Fis domain